MKKIIILLIIIAELSMISCKNKLTFSEEERTLINSGTKEIPFRVLKVTDENDSILLRTSSKNIDKIVNNPDLDLLIERLKTTLIFEDGVGIAAPQVGILKNIFLFVKNGVNGEEIVVAINPKITKHPEETICFENDGCLSVPEISENSKRYPWIEVEYYNEKSELITERLEGYSRKTGFNAIVFQHEFDHLQGILFTDRICK